MNQLYYPQASRDWTTPNVSQGRVIEPKGILIHYTGAHSTKSALNTLTNPAVKASAHFVIGLQGEIYQLAPVNARTWHAGISAWNKLKSLNSHYVGVEIVNAGWNVQKDEQAWFDGYGNCLSLEAISVKHKHESLSRYWAQYHDSQYKTMYDLSQWLVRQWPSIEWQVGHDDVSPGRKQDPGPAFNWDMIGGWGKIA